MAPLCAVAEVTSELPRLVRFSLYSSAILVKVGDTVIGYHNICPHMGVELDWEPRRLVSPDGRHLRCTVHGALFRREDGFCVWGPCDGKRLTAFPIVVRDGQVCADAASGPRI
jgi:nitrite reductase/ring-hydroxylating ferredoxin subunit